MSKERNAMQCNAIDWRCCWYDDSPWLRLCRLFAGCLQRRNRAEDGGRSQEWRLKLPWSDKSRQLRQRQTEIRWPRCGPRPDNPTLTRVEQQPIHFVGSRADAMDDG